MGGGGQFVKGEGWGARGDLPLRTGTASLGTAGGATVADFGADRTSSQMRMRPAPSKAMRSSGFLAAWGAPPAATADCASAAAASPASVTSNRAACMPNAWGAEPARRGRRRANGVRAAEDGDGFLRCFMMLYTRKRAPFVFNGCLLRGTFDSVGQQPAPLWRARRRTQKRLISQVQ